MTEVWGELSL